MLQTEVVGDALGLIRSKLDVYDVERYSQLFPSLVLSSIISFRRSASTSSFRFL